MALTPEERALNRMEECDCVEPDYRPCNVCIQSGVRAAIAEEREAWTQATDHMCGCNRCLDAIEALRARP